MALIVSFGHHYLNKTNHYSFYIVSYFEQMSTSNLMLVSVIVPHKRGSYQLTVGCFQTEASFCYDRQATELIQTSVLAYLLWKNTTRGDMPN